MMESKKEQARKDALTLKQHLTVKYAEPLPCESAIQKAIDSVLRSIGVLSSRIVDHRYKLLHPICDQLIRSATSVGANLAEGRGRASYPCLVAFGGISRGSLFEVLMHLQYLSMMLVFQHGKDDVASGCNEVMPLLEESARLWNIAAREFENDWKSILVESYEYRCPNPPAKPPKVVDELPPPPLLELDYPTDLHIN